MLGVVVADICVGELMLAHVVVLWKRIEASTGMVAIVKSCEVAPGVAGADPVGVWGDS